MIRTFHHADFDAADLVVAKRRQSVSVCLPARNEATTIGPIIERIRRELIEDVPLVDELIVIDDHSDDATAAVARDAGATVFAADAVLADIATGHGKGQAMWKSLHVSSGDLVVWCDADVHDFSTGYITGLVGPLLTRPDLVFVKGYYDRPLSHEGEGGGRVTELVARPVLSLLFPALAAVVQPLAGEYAGRRSVLERVPFVEGYGVDIALLIDIAERCGAEAIGQTDLGVRRHRNRPLDELSPQATAVLQAALRRAAPHLAGPATVLARPGLDPVRVVAHELPPIAELGDGQRHSA